MINCSVVTRLREFYAERDLSTIDYWIIIVIYIPIPIHTLVYNSLAYPFYRFNREFDISNAHYLNFWFIRYLIILTGTKFNITIIREYIFLN